MSCPKKQFSGGTRTAAAYRIGAVCLVAAMLSGMRNAQGTPLHGLSNIFRAQNPEAYGKHLSGVVEQIESTELRAGTVDQLRKARTNSPSTPGPGGPGKNPSGKKQVPRADRNTAIRLTPGGALESMPVKDRPGQAVLEPEPIARKLAAKPIGRADRPDPARDAAMSQGRMQAFELIEVLAYFNPENVNWDGHMGPDCDYAGFRQTALDGLRQLGQLGADTVCQAVAQELTAVTVPREVAQAKESYALTFNGVYRAQAGNPLTRGREPIPDASALTNEQVVQQTLLMNPTYHGDLIDLLRYFDGQGLLSQQARSRLLALSQGKKDPEVQPLALAVRGLQDFTTVSLEDLLSRQGEPRVDAELKTRVRSSGVLGLLQLQTEGRGELRKLAEQELSRRSPRFAEVEADLSAMLPFLNAADSSVAQAAARQFANAFQRAPLPQCLVWLGTGDAQLQPLIWQQIDGRIARADEARRQSYREAALQVLGDKQLAVESRRAALQLLVRLRDPQSVDPLIEALPQLPRELFGEAGMTLRQLTGQDFGPRAGDSVADVVLAAKRWRAWRK